MKTGALILCRYNSSRLPGKILIEIEGQPVLMHIYQRLRKVLPASEIIVTTSNAPTDNPIADFCASNEMLCFRGDLDDVAGRFLAAAKHFELDYAIRINGDNLFVDMDTFREMKTDAETGKYDFLTNVKDRTFPFGMSIEMVRTEFFELVYQKMDLPEYFEHVTLYLYRNEIGKTKYFYNTKCPEASGLQMAIDEPHDLERAKRIMQLLRPREYEYTLNELYAITQSI